MCFSNFFSEIGGKKWKKKWNLLLGVFENEMFKGLFPKTSFQKDIVKYDFISVFIFSKKKTDNETKKQNLKIYQTSP